MARVSMSDDITAAVVGAMVGGMVGQPIIGAAIAAPVSQYVQKFMQKKYNILGGAISKPSGRIGGFKVRGDRSCKNV